MAYGELFRHFTIRFSLKKGQHVRLLQKFEDKKLTDGKVKNQLVMDALEMYFDALEKGTSQEPQEEEIPACLEKRLAVMKEEIKVEVLQEILRAVLGNAITGQTAVASPSASKPEIVDTEEDGAGEDMADISGMPDVMEKIMGWSEN